MPQAKKRFGQHFLHDGNVIERIIRAIGPREGDDLVEIGPGPGALTVPLLKRCGRLDVVELDRDIIPVLQRAVGELPGLQIHQADALAFDFTALARPGSRLRLVGNLPYNISTPLLFHVLDYGSRIADMHFMLQKEVVDRICAEPGTADYGRLSVAVAARAEAYNLFKVGPGAFKPPPKVDSAVVRIVPRPPAFEIIDFASLDRVLIAAFGQRRKQLANSLGSLMNTADIESAGIDPQLRAERLSAAEFARLANLLAKRPTDPQ